MQIYLTSTQVREADKNTIRFGMPSEVLMKRAGRALADEAQTVAAQINTNDVLVVCGTGNNGGDGYVAACELMKRGFNVAVYQLTGDQSRSCVREMKRYKGKFVRTIGGKIILDCIFGTGLNRNLTGEFLNVVKKINASKAYVISADIPSGLNGDNGVIMGAAVKAKLTVALGYPKLGCVLGNGMEYSGEVIVKDIGIIAEDEGTQSYEERDVSEFYKPRSRNTHKGDYGAACVVAGSEEYLGASALAISGALRSGCGYTYAVVPEGMKYSLATAYPQCIYVAQPAMDAGAIAFGMGLGCTKQTYESLCALLKSYKGKLVIDADGLNALAEYGKDVLKQTKAKVLVTPHVGEMSRLTGKKAEDVLQDPVGVAKAFAKEYNVIVHLKSAVSVTTDGTRAAISLRGNASLAKAGSGDVLSGFICGTAAKGTSLFEAAVCGQYVLGCAAEYCCRTMADGQLVASDLTNAIPLVIKTLKK